MQSLLASGSRTNDASQATDIATDAFAFANAFIRVRDNAGRKP